MSWQKKRVDELWVWTPRNFDAENRQTHLHPPSGTIILGHRSVDRGIELDLDARHDE
jgi:hypothetical protein